MTGTNTKVRGLFLAALLLVSAPLGAVAFTGTVAAAGTVQNAEFTVDSAQPDTATTLNASGTVNESGSISGVAVDFSGADGFDGGFAGVSSADVTVYFYDTSTGTLNATVNSPNVSTGNGGETLTATFSSQQVEADWRVVTVVDGFQNPTSDGDYAGTYDLNPGTESAWTDASATLSVGTATSGQANATLVDGGTYWQGQTLYRASGVEAGETLELRNQSDDTLVTQVTADGDGELLIETADLDGRYYLEDSDNNVVASFEVARQTFSASIASDSVTNGGDDATTDLTFDSNRGTYEVRVTATHNGSAVSAATLANVFGTVQRRGDESVVVAAEADTTRTLNFSGVDAGQYNFSYDVVDTSAAAESSVKVTDVGTTRATFARDAVEAEQGDVAAVTVEFDGTADSATLLVGDESSSGYQANVSLVDGNDDGQVTVLFNTYTAGDGESRTVVRAKDDADTVRLDGETNLETLLDRNDYRMAVSTGDVERTEERPSDVGTFFVAERSTSGVQLWTAPGATTGSDEALHGAATQDAAFVASDWVVVQLQASGLEGLVQAEGNLSAAIRSGALDVSVVQTNPGQNREPKVLDVSETTFTTFTDTANDAYYVAFRPSEASFHRKGSPSETVSVAAGDQFNASVAVTDDRLLGDADAEQRVSRSLEIVAGDVSLAESPVTVEAAANRTVAGSSTYAPGTEFTVRVRSAGDTQPSFYKSETVTVQADGSWSATFDFAAQSAGDTFTLSSAGISPALSADGEVTEKTTPTATPTATATATSTATATASPTPTATTPSATATPTATETETPTTGFGLPGSLPGFGIAVVIVVVLAVAALAVRD